MFLNSWLTQPLKTRSGRHNSNQRTLTLELQKLEDRVTPAVYYFHGGNLFGPQDNPFDGNDWRNAFNWGKDDNGTIVVGQGTPGEGDIAVFKGSTEDGKAWQVASGHKDTNGNYDEFTTTTGRSVKIDTGVAVSVLNVDTTYGFDLFSSSGQGSITATNGRLQAGNFGIKLNNAGAIDIATASIGQISFASTFTNFGTVNITSGNVRLDIPQANGSFALGSFINPTGSMLQFSGDAKITGAGRLQNDGLVTASGVNAIQAADVISSGNAEYRITSGDFRFTGSSFSGGPRAFDAGRFTVSPGAKLHFDGDGALSFQGSTTFQGGGFVEIAAVGPIQLNQAVFTTVNTTLEVNGGFSNRTGATRFTGTGGLTANSMMTISDGVFSGASLTNNGTIRFAATTSNPTPNNDLFGIVDNSQILNNGLISVGVPQFPITNGQLLNTKLGIVEFTGSTTINGGNGLFVNEGTIRTRPTAGSIILRAALDNLGGTLDIQGGTVSIPGNQGPDSGGSSSTRSKLFAAFGLNRASIGVSIGGTFNVAAGATLDLRAPENLFTSGPAFAGKFQGSGGGKILLGGEMQMRTADWNFAAGMLHWQAFDNNTNRISGDWSNHGDLTLTSTATNSSLTLLYGTLTNSGTVNISNNTRLELTYFPSFSRFVNSVEGTVHFGKSVLVNGAGPGNGLRDIYDPNGSFFANKGLANFDGDVNFNAIVDNTGTFETRTKSNIGIGYFPRIHPDVERLSIGGTWIARSGSSVNFDRLNNGNPSQSAPLIFRGNVAVDGVGSSLPWLSTISDNFGSIAVTNGATLTLGDQSDPANNRLTHSGSITLNGGTILLPGSFTQTSTGKLTTIVGGGLSQLTVGKTASLGGFLTTAGVAGFTPAETDRFDVVVAKSVFGAFARQSLNGFVSQLTPTTVTLAPASQAVDISISDVKLLPGNGLEIAPGAPFSVQFTVRNLTNQAITANWVDAVFFSDNDALDSADTLLARFADIGGIMAFGSRTVTIPLTAPATPGQWSIIVAADSQAKLMDLNRQNNVATARESLRIGYADLPLGVDVSAAFPVGDTTYYRLTISPGSGPIRVTANFAADNAGQLSARLGELPLGAADDLIANSIVNGNGRTATIDLPDASAGVYFIAVKRLVGSPVILRAEVQTLRITGFDNPNLNPELRANDTLQLVVRGTGFTPSSLFKLGDTVGVTTFVNATTAIVSFVVPETTQTLFVSVVNNSSTFTATSTPFTVHVYNAGVLRGFASFPRERLPNWLVQISMPREVRPFRDVRATVTFQNNSPFSQAAPLIQLLVSQAFLRLPSQSQSIRQYMEVLGVKSSGGDRYAPGEVGSFEVIVVPDVATVHQFFELNATVIAENRLSSSGGVAIDPFLGETLTEVPLPNNFVDALRLTTHSEAAWVNVIRPRLREIIGNTSRSYADALRDAARVLQLDDADTHDVARLNHYLINLAEDYGQVENRFQLSAFGRGQSNPYDIYIETDAEGNELVFVGNESRPFMRVAGGYQGLSGDRGTLAARVGGGWLLTEINGNQLAFRTDGKLEYRQDQAGRRTTFTYANNRLISFTDFQNDTTTLAYNTSGRIVSITNAVGMVTAFGYDPTGELLTSITTPTGTTTYEYAGTNGVNAFALTGITGPDGIRTVYEYVDGRLVSVSRAGQTQWSYTYGRGTTLGQVSITDSLGNVSRGLLGEFGQITRRIDALGRITDSIVDTNGRTISVTTPRSGTVQTLLDSNGNITSIIDVTGNRIRIGYNPDGVAANSIRDPLGRQSSSDYNDASQLTAQTDTQGSVRYSYDPNGNLVGTVSNGNRSYQTIFNSKNLPTRREYGDGTYTTYEYDARRNLTKVTDYEISGSNPKSVTMTYDAANRMTSVTYANGSSVTYRYDSAGRVDRITPSNSPAMAYAYDTLGRLSTVSRGGIIEVTYGYDALNRSQRSRSPMALPQSPVTMHSAESHESSIAESVGRFWISKPTNTAQATTSSQ